MIADLKPYPDYKESGLPWLGLSWEHSGPEARRQFCFNYRIGVCHKPARFDLADVKVECRLGAAGVTGCSGYSWAIGRVTVLEMLRLPHANS
jgi:hypothetical protein